jgi:hypothetical protein
MALVSHNYEFVFLKTHKTASTSTEAALEHLCTENPTTHVASHSAKYRATASGIIGSRAVPEKTLWRNHMPAWKVALLLGPRRWLRYTKITVLRNPFDRAVSRYYHLSPKFKREWARTADADAVILDFRRWLKTQRLNENLDKILILGNVCIDHFLYFESLESDLQALKASLGDPTPLNLNHFKGKQRTNKMHFTRYYDSDSIEIILNKNKLELALGGYEPPTPVT